MPAIDEVHQGRAEEFGLLGWGRAMRRQNHGLRAASTGPRFCKVFARPGKQPCKREYLRRPENPALPRTSALFTADDRASAGLPPHERVEPSADARLLVLIGLSFAEPPSVCRVRSRHLFGRQGRPSTPDMRFSRKMASRTTSLHSTGRIR
jgi:hypothetical protein